MINQVGQSDSSGWLIMKSQPKTFPKTVKPPAQISQRNGCTCIVLFWNSLICNILQAFDHEDIDDYQGDGQGKSSGITPEEYRSEPIVSQTL